MDPKTEATAKLDTNIQKYSATLKELPGDHPSRANWLQKLGVMYRKRYLQTGEIGDLDISTRLQEQSLQNTAINVRTREAWLHNLGVTYKERYQKTGTVEYLDAAISRYEEALKTLPRSHPNQIRELHCLGIAYHDSYERRGRLADLQNAIKKYRATLDLVPENNPVLKNQLSSDLGVWYRLGYQRTGAVEDLRASIQLHKEVLASTADNDPNRANRLHNLGVGYHERYKRTRVQSNLKLAVDHFQKALDVSTSSGLDRAMQMESLGIAYRDIYGLTDTMEMLEKAMQKFQDALDMTPEGHADRSRRLEPLGIGFYDKYRKTRAMADLDVAIQRCQEALDATPDYDSSRAHRLQSLGLCYRVRYDTTGSKPDLDMAIRRWHEALNHPSSIVVDRLTQIEGLLKLYAQAQNWSSAYQAAAVAVSLIPLLTPRSLQRLDKQRLLTHVVGLASDAAAISLNAGKTPYDAIGLLELGRGTILSSLSEMRTEVFDLQQAYPSIARRFIAVRDQLDAVALSTETPIEQPFKPELVLKLVFNKIRKMPGFDRFLLAPSEAELKAAAKHGPIVIINVSSFRCDALIIEEHQLQTIRLPHLDSSDIDAHTKKPCCGNAKKIEPSTEMLEWLWDAIAKPILDVLGLTEKPVDSTWPRIWWIPTGPLAKFPIHAAGYHHSLHSCDTVLDRVISSYSSSIRALVRSPQNRANASTKPGSEKVVLVGMEKTPGQADLPFVSQEIDQVEGLCDSINLPLSKPETLRNAVFKALHNCKILHFAGHGLTNRVDPSQSSLLLSDGPLTVANLISAKLYNKPPFLAYLSACGTGQIKYDRLMDEGLHLISACQLAGFQHVIGTMWEVNDSSCVDMAAMTYEWMKERGLSDESVSEGLHQATRKLRGQWVEENIRRGALGGGTESQNEETGRIATMKDCCLRCDKAATPRDIVSRDEMPLFWIPYVHFGT